MTFIPRPHQTQCVDAIENAFRAGVTRPLVDMCVGSGKSNTMAMLAHRNWQRGERTIILAHRQELVSQNAKACSIIGVPCGINAAKLGERTWRAPVISAMINSVAANAQSFGPVENILIDECHLVPHSEAGMYRQFLRAFLNARVVGFSGTVFRTQSGSLIDGEGALFEKGVFCYTIPDGIRDQYLVPAYSAQAQDKIDVTKLKKTAGEYTASSQDAQMIELMDSHIAQMKVGGADRKAWLVFEASQKAAIAMADRLNAWGVPAAVIIDKTKNREEIIQSFNSGRLRALVNVESLTTGFDSQRIDLVCFRRRTTSLGLYIQMCGRGLRTIGGNLEASIAAGKSDCLYYDFAGLVDAHGPLDFIRPKDTVARLVSCEACGKRNGAAARSCWSCDEPMTKLCPACLVDVVKGTLDCPHCDHDFRLVAEGETLERKPAALLETPSGAALIAAFKPRSALDGGWVPIRKVYQQEDGSVLVDADIYRLTLPTALRAQGSLAKWVRLDDNEQVIAVMCPNGASRSSAIQVDARGNTLVVPLPNAKEAA